MRKTQLEDRFKHLGIPKEELERMRLQLIREQELAMHIEALANVERFSAGGPAGGPAGMTNQINIAEMVDNFQTRVLANGGIFQSQQCLIDLLTNLSNI
jgi:hypothetical protein